MKALITGSRGFVGTHLSAELEANRYEVIPCDLVEGEGIVAMDIMNPEMIRSVLEKYQPDVLINMAGQANVGLSWKEPKLTVQLNTVGLINILEVVRVLNPQMRIIAVGSSDEYGPLGNQGIDITEDISVNPATPYAISKYAQEAFAKLYSCVYGMNVCMTRQFNIGGAGQMKGYLVSDFASGIADIEAGKREYLTVGNLDSARDFTHVKDACRAIRLIVEKGRAGEVYNICSGKTYTAQEVLVKLISMSKVKIKVVQNPDKMRPSDTPIICGNHDKLTAHTGWKPELTVDQMLKDSLNYWRAIN